MRYAILFGVLALLLPRHSAAADVSVELLPGRSAIAFRAYGIGLLPLDGQFTHFHGRFSYDPEAPTHCAVALQVDVASLAVAPATVGETVLGPDFLDAAESPRLAYDGVCGIGGLTGRLTMHGVTRPFALTLDWAPDSLVAAGQLRRTDWGMTAMPILVGSTVRIEVSVRLAGAPHAGP